MLNIGMPELLLVMGVALLVFGPRKLPEISRMLGKAMREFRRAADDLRQSLEQEPPEEIVKEVEEKLQSGPQEPHKGEELRG